VGDKTKSATGSETPKLGRTRAAQDADAARELRILLGRAQELPRALPAGDGGPVGDQPPRPGPWARLRRRLRGE